MTNLWRTYALVLTGLAFAVAVDTVRLYRELIPKLP